MANIVLETWGQKKSAFYSSLKWRVGQKKKSCREGLRQMRQLITAAQENRIKHKSVHDIWSLTFHYVLQLWNLFLLNPFGSSPTAGLRDEKEYSWFMFLWKEMLPLLLRKEQKAPWVINLWQIPGSVHWSCVILCNIDSLKHYHHYSCLVLNLCLTHTVGAKSAVVDHFQGMEWVFRIVPNLFRILASATCWNDWS